MEESAEAASGVEGPGAPRAILKVGEGGEQIAGGEVLGVIPDQEAGADVEEQLHGEGALGKAEDCADGGAGPFGPRSADEIGDVKERLGAILLVRGEAGRNSRRGLVSDLGEGVGVGLDPVGDGFKQPRGIVGGRAGEPETADRVRGLPAMEHDGKAARRQGARQRRIAGEGFGTEDAVLGTIAGVTSGSVSAGVENGDQGLAVGAVQGMVAVVQQDGVGRPVHEVFLSFDTSLRRKQLVGDGPGIGAGGQPGRVAKQLEQFETEAFARLRLRRADRQIGSGGKAFEAPSIDDPQGEDRKLVGFAGQVTSEEAGDGVGDGRAGSGFDGRGFFDLVQSGRGHGERFRQVCLCAVHTFPA